MNMAPNVWMRLCRFLQLALICLIFGLDFGHGILLGEHDIGFHPIYRLRQTLAVAISRLHNPPAHGYLAYKSVIESLNQNGFAIFPEDNGPHLNVKNWSALFKDTARMDRALREAKDTTVDLTLPPQLIRGNELGYADYIYFAFRLFGLHIASLYYFYFLLLGIACVLFLIEYRDSPFLLFLLTTYLAGLFFLQNYANSEGDQLSSLANSRLFDALSLLPAVHIFLAIWQLRLPRRLTLMTVGAQAVILIFLVNSRTAALWQIGMIVLAGLAVTVAAARPGRYSVLQWNKRFVAGGWPGTITIVLLVLYTAFIKLDADRLYTQETETHLIWHSALSGILESSPDLQLIYVGNENALSDDQIAYAAVTKDLNERHDASSPVALMDNSGRIFIDLRRSNAAYDRLARSLVLRIILAHPLYVLAGIREKISEQINWYTLHSAMKWQNLANAIVLSMIAGLLWIGASGGRVLKRDTLSGFAAVAVILSCALVPPLIEPSNLSVGTLLCFLIAGFMGFMLVLLLLANSLISAFLPQSKVHAFVPQFDDHNHVRDRNGPAAAADLNLGGRS